MKTAIEKVLDKWIELGAEYKEEKVINATVVRGEIEISIRRIIITKSKHTILYGDSNLWEVMFSNKDEYVTIYCIYEENESGYYSNKISKRAFHRAKSLLSEDPREYIVENSPLFDSN